MDESLEDFPKFSEGQLQDITLGVYQIKRARSYTQEHISEDGKYNFSVHKEENGLIRVRIQSHHRTCRLYFLWIS